MGTRGDQACLDFTTNRDQRVSSVNVQLFPSNTLGHAQAVKASITVERDEALAPGPLAASHFTQIPPDQNLKIRHRCSKRN